MEMETLKAQWAAYDQKLEAGLQMNRALLREAVLNKSRSALQRLTRGVVIELFIDLAILILLGQFIAGHVGKLEFLLPALVLHVFVIVQVGFDGYQWAMLASLDFSAPIPDVQKKIARLKVQRIQVTKWSLWLAPLLWVPMLMVALKGLFGIDAYAVLSARWLVVNVLFGAAVIPLMIWLSRRYAGRMSRSSRFQRLMDDFAGHDLKRATVFLDEVSRLETR
jgi:serine/threonine-protein kinase